MEPSVPSELDQWFEYARRDRVHRRSPMYGMKTTDSIVDMLLDWGKTVAEGNSFVSQRPLPLTRESLAEVDEAILAIRRQRGARLPNRILRERWRPRGSFWPSCSTSSTPM